ncbi:MAG: PDZ domain-containing protein [Planctomycetes bacterium]|nr:PDZ domain-containing protein [Planctomycetota bacterium]
MINVLLILCLQAGRVQDKSDEALTTFERRIQQVARQATDAFVFLGGGSGVLISPEGWVLSNHHVIAGFGGKAPPRTRVTLSDGRQLWAKVVCCDDRGDLALLKMEPEADKPFPYLEFGDSDKLECGQYVMAVGNPFNLAAPTGDKRWYPSVSLGIVSAVHRYQEQYSDCIQTDAAVNPGNSGGPLVTLDGKVVGINGRIATRYMNRVNSGVGYAIASSQIKNFLPEMMKGGIAGLIYHGQIRGLQIDSRAQEGQGARVADVRAGSPAARAGFKEGDVVVQVNDYPVASATRFHGVIGIYPMGSAVSVRVKRQDETIVLKVPLDRTDGVNILNQRPKAGGAYLGVVLEDKDGGAEVTYVSPGSPADEAGLQVGDVLVEIDGTKVQRRETVLERVRLLKPGNTIALVVRREGEEFELSVKLGKK